MQCGALPKGVDLEVFDFGVNAGPGQSVKTLQKIVGVTQDGSIGPITLAAARTINSRDLVTRFSHERLTVYQSLPEWATYGNTWTSRTQQIEADALKMIASSQVIAA